MPLRQLYPEPGAAEPLAKVDVFAVHGLNPRNKKSVNHAWDTWRTPPGPEGRLWLRDNLPSLLPESRIFLYEYHATVVYGQDRDTFLGKANELLEAIRIERDEVESRPILFLGHSMGGLLIKQALINAHINPKYTTIKDAASGLAFFGTPHKGGDGMLVSLGGLAVQIARATGFQKSDNIMKVLESGNMFSDIMDEHWRHQLLAYDIVSFWGALDSVVPRESARLGLPGDRENIVKLDADHHGVCKFGESQTDQDNLKLVQANLKDLYKNALKNSGRDTRNKPLRDTRLSCHYIPLARNNQFSGRKGILDELQKRLFVRKDCRKLAVFGLGGVGKTQVALQFAYWVKDNHPDFSVLWMPALSNESFDQAYMELARRLAIPMNKGEDPKESVRRYLTLESTGKWLLIVDNADSYELLFGPSDKPGGINMYLPQSDNSLILFTTRVREVAVAAVGSDVIDLHKMDLEEAASCLEKMLIQKELLQNETEVKKLLRELTCLPLAISQAAAYLNRNQMTVKKYLGLLRGNEQSMIELMSREFHDNTRYSGSQNAVATTWLVSFDEIRKSDSAAAELLSFISYIEPKAIPRSLLPNRWSDEEMVTAIGTLLGYGFLVRREEEDMFDMHRLVHVATRVWLQRHEMANQKETDVIQHFEATFPFNPRKNRELCRQYLPHALRVLEGSRESQIDERYDLSYRVGRYLCQDRRYKEALKPFEEAYAWRREHAYQDTRRLLSLENWLAVVYRHNNRLKEAIKISERIVAIQRKTLGEEDHSRLTSEDSLGKAYIRDKQMKKGIEILEHVVAIRRRTQAEDDDFRLASEHELAVAYIKNGRIEEGIKILEDVVAVGRRTLAEEDSNRLAPEHNLGRAYLDGNKVKEAIAILEHVVAVEAKILDVDDASRVNSQECLAFAYSKL
ncbi:TPR-like protein [Hypoxylon cercidicola]|nr:TPR-like protein [Hypoxylon cercidicola]